MVCSLCADFELSDQVTVISPPQKKKQCRAVRTFQGPTTKGRRLVEGRALNCKAGPYVQRRTVRSTHLLCDQCKGRTINAGDARSMQGAVRSMQGPYDHCKRPYAPCRAVRSMQGRTLHAGPHGQWRAVCSMQGRLLNAGGRAVNAGAARAMQGPFGRVVNAGPHDHCRGAVCSMQGAVLSLKSRKVRSQCRAVRPMEGRTLNAGPHAQCKHEGRVRVYCTCSARHHRAPP